MSDHRVVHENENYQVLVAPDFSSYILYNRDTDVVEEDQIMSLPSAISIAEQSNAYLLYETWQWIRRQEETNNGIAETQLTIHDLDVN